MKHEVIQQQVSAALVEDMGSGDITASLIGATVLATAKIITREDMILCGKAWVDEVFHQLDPAIKIHWHAHDGDLIRAEHFVCELEGNARALLSGERAAINFLQTLSATASVTHRYAVLIKEFPTKLLDTRKTLPGWRAAQKYAVRCGGGHNHRMGLYDAFLIKENHIIACGSIKLAIEQARKNFPGKAIEVEVENLAELEEALANHADSVLLDNFPLKELKAAVAINAGRSKLEASGGVTLENIHAIAATGVDFISVGSLTKHIHAIDLSMRLQTCA